MRSHPLVTIGIPTYNRAEGYFREALESALSQTYPSLEIVISDNFSSDNTEALVKSYSDPRVRYFKQCKNIPPNDNFNFCLKQANGDYFLLLHDDDLIDNDFVERCVKGAKGATHIGIIRTGARIIDSTGNVLKERRNLDSDLSTVDFFISWLESKSWMFLCAILFNTEKLKGIGGFGSKHQLFQDVLAEFMMAAKFGRVDVPEVKASFRKHGSQRTGVATVTNWCEDSLILLDAMCKLVPEKEKPIRKKGLEHFSKHNYALAAGIKLPFRRYQAYLEIYRMFDYSYAPWRYFPARARRRVFTQLGRAKRGLARSLGLKVLA